MYLNIIIFYLKIIEYTDTHLEFTILFIITINILLQITLLPLTNHVISGTGFDGPDVQVASNISPTLNTSLKISIVGSVF